MNNINNKKGYILPVSIFMIFLLLSVGVSAAGLLVTANNIKSDFLRGTKVFYLSEAGIETAKSRIASSEGWATDEPHAENDKKWLLASSKGEISLFGEGGFKIVKEKNKNVIYSVGFIGSDILKSRYYSFQRLDYELPFKQKHWEEL
ncbi:MAG: hypothetical protein NTZ10_05180 [Candidatus Saganbacteria bacterium]|nr:hypothetical protein [Candidatus Saganbacteria bacterium]